MLTDHPPYRVIAATQIPALPGRRKKFTDPDFGTTLIQLTDESDGAICRISYGIWPAFSCDYGKILIQCDSLFKVVTWNSTSMDGWGDITLPESFQGGDAIWSNSDPDLIYHRDGGSRLLALNVVTGADTLIYDASADFPDSPLLTRMSASQDCQTFCFARQRKSYGFSGFCVFSVSRGLIFREPPSRSGQYFKVQIDKSGQYVWNVAMDPQSEFWDLSLPNSQQTVLTAGTGHSAMLSGLLAQYDNSGNCDVLRTLPKGPAMRLLAWPDWTLATEYCGTFSDDWYAVTAAGQWPYTDGPLHDELLCVPTDGSGDVQRICRLHNKLVDGDYNSIPQPAAGYGAHPWIAFHSSWGDQPRRDVFLARCDSTLTNETKRQPVITGSYPLNFIILYAKEEPIAFSVIVSGVPAVVGGPWQIENGQWQLNVEIPASLIGAGEVPVVLICAGVASEPLIVKV